jgi:DNA-binding IclR family transcriptional regulator
MARRTRTVSLIDTKTGNKAVVKSAARVLQILEIFDDTQREMRVGEIAEHTGYPQSSTSVLLKSLASLGYLDFDIATRSYLPTARVALLGAWISDAVANGAVIRLMEELSEETGATITLAARNGIYAQYIHVLQATNTLRLHTPTGTKRLLVWSAAGFALLRDVPEDEVLMLVRRTNAEQGRHKIDGKQVLAHIAEFRRQGYFFSRELVTPGGGHISMSLPPGRNRRERPLAIGVSGWIEDLDREENRIVRVMRKVISNPGR